MGLAGFTVAVSVAMALAPRSSAGNLATILTNSPGLVGERLWLWQLLTASFLHTGVLHLAINMFFLLWLGSALEVLMGSRQFLFFYLTSGVFAYALFDAWALLGGAGGPTAGASGCVLAMAVLYTLAFPKQIVVLYGLLSVPFRWIVLLFVLSDATTLLWPGGILLINHKLHLSGAVFGAGWWWVSLRKGKMHGRNKAPDPPPTPPHRPR